jgi:hypothetical protein
MPRCRAHVEQGADFALFVPGNDEGILEHPPDDIVAGLRHFGLVGDEQPAAAKEPLFFEVEDFLVVVDVGRDHPLPHILQDRTLVCHSCSPWQIFSLLSRKYFFR